MNKIRLIGESSNSYLFVYEDEDVSGDDNNSLEMKPSFIYINRDGEEIYRGCNLLGSVLAHNPYWDKPTKQFSESELERISRMLPEVTCTLPRIIERQIAGLRLMKERTHGDMKDYVFAFIREDENQNRIPMNWGFLYSKSDKQEIRYGICRLDALYAHISGLEEAHTLFTEDEMQRIDSLKITGNYK